MYLMQLAKLYLRDICFKKCFIKILNSIAKFIACVVTYLCSGGHPRRRHSGQESPATRGGAATRPRAPGNPRWWWRGQAPPPHWRLSGQGPGAAYRCAPHLNRQEPPPAAHQHRSRHRRRTRTDDRSSHGGPGSDKEEAGSGPGGRRR
jgi:hypothetical protein